MPDDKKELTPEQIEVNKKKSEGVRGRWNRRTEEKLEGIDRSTQKFDYKCFDGLGLSKMQKKFVVTFMDSPYFGKREFRYDAYKKVFNPSNDNSCRANCTALLNKQKVKEAMTLYQIESLKNHKLEVTTESIEVLRRRSNYSVSIFYNNDGTCKDLSEIDQEWLCCIDNIKIDKKSNAGKAPIETKEYVLCNRDKARAELVKMLGVFRDMESLQVQVPVSAEKTVLDKDEGKVIGPRITMNFSVGAGLEGKN